MVHPAALSLTNVQIPQTYIRSEETTLRKSILEKVAIFGILLGSGLLLVGFYTSISLLVTGAVTTALSAYAVHFLLASSQKLCDAAETANRCMLNLLQQTKLALLFRQFSEAIT
jgi:hypothetical protein